jgi:hypothetical protein
MDLLLDSPVMSEGEYVNAILECLQLIDEKQYGTNSPIIGINPRLKIKELRQRLKIEQTVQEKINSEANEILDKILLHERELNKHNILNWKEITPINGTKVGLARHDITLIKIDSIVNAANSGLMGCFTPNHPCIDNVIHCRAGGKLRLECKKLVQQINGPEETGNAKLTPAFCLPSKYIIHTVGPIYP